MRNSFSQFLFNQFKRNETLLHELKYLFWECTQRCNLNCLHCGSDCTASASAKDLPFDDFLRAILPLKNVYKKNSITVAITGGEPLLREDLPKCGLALRENGFRWGIVTNGYEYTPEMHSKLLAAGIGSITVSLDGMEENHNWLRANNQSFKRAVRALNLITPSKRLNYDVVTCMNGKNIDELETLKEFLISINVKAWRLFTISPIGRAAKNEIMSLSPQQLKKLMDFIAAARSDTRIKTNFSCEAYLGKYELKARDSYFFCRAGIQIASVLIDGSISACPNIDRSFIQGSIYKDNFLDIWNNKFETMRNRNWCKTGICANCAVYKNCSGGAMHLRDGKQKEVMKCIYNDIREL